MLTHSYHHHHRRRHHRLRLFLLRWWWWRWYYSTFGVVISGMSLVLTHSFHPSLYQYYYHLSSDSDVPTIWSYMQQWWCSSTTACMIRLLVRLSLMIHAVVLLHHQQQQQRRWWPQSTQLQTHVLNAHCIVICEADKPNCVGLILLYRNIISWFVVGGRWWTTAPQPQRINTTFYLQFYAHCIPWDR